MKKNGDFRKVNRLLKKVKKKIKDIRKLDDDQLAAKTSEFKNRYEGGETLLRMLPEAFAVICEADRRILNKSPYDVQIFGGIALFLGYMAEMNTGEGKTLSATMPLYLNAISGKSTILITTNEYLAKRDAAEMGQVYRFMGLTVSGHEEDVPGVNISNAEKKRRYSCDIVYTTNSGIGFDYLLDNLVKRAADRFMPEFDYVIIDEADAVLLDSAQTPLVISGSPRVQSNLYSMADFFVTTLEEDTDYIIEDKAVWLTDEGVKRTESYFSIDNLYSEKNFEINRHVVLALRAHTLFEHERDYIVDDDGSLLLIDGSSGRKLSGVKLGGGQHQAIESKEHIKITQETRAMASITYQNLFCLFPKMAGMSGTISDVSYELMDIYNKKVLVVPPNRPVRRKDMPDKYFRTMEAQIDAAVDEIIRVHETGQPVLVIVANIAVSEVVSEILMEKGIAHNLLNANNAYWEAMMIKEAGQKNAVTVATSMAGRGTDIRLGEGVSELGGLEVIGIGRMPNTRQERQARGRSGRQGDKGISKFFVSLEDDVTSVYGEERIEKLLKKRHVSIRKIKKIVNFSQKLGDEMAVAARKKGKESDMVIKRQRELIYKTRDNLINGENISTAVIEKIAKANIHEFLKSQKVLTREIVGRYVLDNISYSLDRVIPDIDDLEKIYAFYEMENYLMRMVRGSIKRQRQCLGSESRMNEFMRNATLAAIDDAWVEEVDYLQQLSAAVSGRASAQRNVIFEYQREAYESFNKMEKTIHINLVRNILLSSVYVDDKYNMHIQYP